MEKNKNVVESLCKEIFNFFTLFNLIIPNSLKLIIVKMSEKNIYWEIVENRQSFESFFQRLTYEGFTILTPSFNFIFSHFSNCYLIWLTDGDFTELRHSPVELSSEELSSKKLRNNLISKGIITFIIGFNPPNVSILEGISNKENFYQIEQKESFLKRFENEIRNLLYYKSILPKKADILSQIIPEIEAEREREKRENRQTHMIIILLPIQGFAIWDEKGNIKRFISGVLRPCIIICHPLNISQNIICSLSSQNLSEPRKLKSLWSFPLEVFIDIEKVKEFLGISDINEIIDRLYLYFYKKDKSIFGLFTFEHLLSEEQTEAINIINQLF